MSSPALTPPHARLGTRHRNRAGRLLVALALSCALHVVGLLLSRKAPPPSLVETPTVELEINEMPALARPEEPAVAEPGSSKRSAPLAKQSPKKKAEGQIGSTSSVALAKRELASDIPLTSRDAGTPLRRFPSLRLTLPPTTSEEPEEPIISGLSGIHAPPIYKNLVGATVAQSLGRQRVQSGNVDPYFSRLRDSLTEIWNAKRPDHKTSSRPASVRIVQGHSGRLVSAELVSTFSDPGWDRGLLLDLKQSAHRLPQPPIEVFGGHGYLSSLWSFQYAPQAFTDFDVVNVFDKRAIKKSDGKRVQLLSAEPTD